MTLVELKPLGRCTECREPRWQVATCTCSHAVMIHNLGKRAGVTVRTDCSRSGCGCRTFREATDG